MSSSFFISKKLKKKIQKDIVKRQKIEDEISNLQESLDKHQGNITNDLEEFYQQVDTVTVISTLEYVQANNPNKKEVATQIKKNFYNNSLAIDDTITLIDWYEKMIDDHNNF